MSNDTQNDTEARFSAPALTVLVAEKHPIARAAIAALLRQAGYEAYQAENLQTAISYMSQIERLAVLLVDLEMPGWRSIVRHAMKTTGVLVLGMEGNHPIAEMYDLAQRGIRLCLQKPIEFDELRDAIKRHIGLENASNVSLPESTFKQSSR